jgi:hypothetical protein
MVAGCSTTSPRFVQTSGSVISTFCETPLFATQIGTLLVLEASSDRATSVPALPGAVASTTRTVMVGHSEPPDGEYESGMIGPWQVTRAPLAEQSPL